MLIKTSIVFAAAIASSALALAQPAAAQNYYRGYGPYGHQGDMISRSVALPYYDSGENFSRYSGPFRTDASPNSGGS